MDGELLARGAVVYEQQHPKQYGTNFQVLTMQTLENKYFIEASLLMSLR
jgi:hypothetical protein